MTTTNSTKTTTDIQVALRQATAKLAEAISDLSSLQVTTRWVKVAEDGAIDIKDARPVAETIIHLDGDIEMTIPVRVENGILVRDDDLLELHLGSVKSAMEYRQKLIETILATGRKAVGR